MKDDLTSRAAESFSKSLQSNQWDFLPVIFGQFHNTKQDLYACVSGEITWKKWRKKGGKNSEKAQNFDRRKKPAIFPRKVLFFATYVIYVTLRLILFPHILVEGTKGLDPSPPLEFIILLLSATFLFLLRLFVFFLVSF